MRKTDATAQKAEQKLRLKQQNKAKTRKTVDNQGDFIVIHKTCGT